MTRRSSMVRLWGTVGLLTAGAAALSFLVSRAPLPASVPTPPPPTRPAACERGDLLAAGRTPPLALAPKGHEVFRIPRRRGQVLDAAVDQEGIDVVVHLWTPRGRELLRVKGPKWEWTAEPVFALAEEDGVYCLEVEANEDWPRPGRFQVRLAPRRRPLPLDGQRASGHRAFSRAEALRRDNKPGAALPLYQQALRAFHASGDRERLGPAFYRLGDLLYGLGRNKEARDQLFEAAHQFAGSADEAMADNKLGSVYEALSDADCAFAMLNQAQTIAERFGDRIRKAGGLNNLGYFFQGQGRLEEALKAFSEAQEEWRREGNLHEQMVTLQGLADFNLDLGRLDAARDTALQAIQIAQSRHESSSETLSRRTLGTAYLRLGYISQSIRELEEALRLGRQVEDASAQSSALGQLGEAYLQAKQFGPAQERFEEALSLARQTGNLELEARAHRGMGEVLGLRGDLPGARRLLADAASFYDQHQDKDGKAWVLESLARVLRQHGRIPEAWAAIEPSLAILEPLRVHQGGGSLRSSFLASRSSAYELAVDILVELDHQEPRHGHGAQAFTIGESARARSFLDELTAAEADVRSKVPADLLSREADIERRLAALEKGREQPGQTAALQELRSQQDLVQADIRAADPRYLLAHARPLSLAQVQSQILADGETALLAYTLGEERSFVWLVRGGSFVGYVLPSRKVIEALAKEAHDALSKAPEGERGGLDEALAKLSRTVLDPVAGELRHDRLLVIADGGLQSIPFAVLPLRGRRLVEDHEIVTLPSASILAALRAEIAKRPHPPQKAVLVFADAVFRSDDERFPPAMRRPAAPLPAGPLGDVARSAARDLGIRGFLPLPNSGIEAESILRMVPPGMGRGALGFDADRRLATGPEPADYGILHFATHAVFDEIHPELSGIVLSLLDRQGRPQEGYLRAYEIYHLNLPVDLVVLSACRTALGTDVRVEGLSGLPRAFMYAGAPRVVVSLWNVSDKGTAHLMELFYRGLLLERLRPAAALRAAQVEMLRGRDWREPYFWAGFILEGEWR